MISKTYRCLPVNYLNWFVLSVCNYKGVLESCIKRPINIKITVNFTAIPILKLFPRANCCHIYTNKRCRSNQQTFFTEHPWTSAS